MNTEVKTGIFDGIANESYHRSGGLSSSGLKYLDQSPAHYQECMANRPEPTSSMLLGTAIHSAVLEQGLERGLVVKAPGSTRSTNLYKDFVKGNAFTPIVTVLLEDEMRRVEGAVKAIERHPLARSLLKGGKAEQSAFWIDDETGVHCRCRPDYLRDDGLVIDLKTTQDASKQAFQSSISKYKYHWQSAWYLDGLSKLLGKTLDNFVHLVVETEAPFGVAVYVLDNGSLDRARVDIRRLLHIYAEAMHTGQWNSYPDEIQNMSLKNWEFEVL